MVKIRKGKFKDVATDYVDDYRTQTFQCNVSHCTNGRVLHVFDDMTNPANKGMYMYTYIVELPCLISTTHVAVIGCQTRTDELVNLSTTTYIYACLLSFMLYTEQAQAQQAA